MWKRKQQIVLTDDEINTTHINIDATTLVVVVVNSSVRSKNPYGFLNTQGSATKLRMHIRADTVHRSTVSGFPFIF